MSGDEWSGHISLLCGGAAGNYPRPSWTTESVDALRGEREALLVWAHRLYDLDAEAPLLTQPEQHSLARLLGRLPCNRQSDSGGEEISRSGVDP